MSAAEKEFVLTHVFKNVSSIRDGQRHFSPIEEHFGVPWKISVQYKKHQVGIFLDCDQKKDNEWSIDTLRETKITAINGKDYSKTNEVFFRSTFKGACWNWLEFISWDRMIKFYVIDDTLKVEVRVKIKKMTGIKTKEKKNLMSFDESNKEFSDVTLVVKNQKFYISKLIMTTAEKEFVITHVFKNVSSMKDGDRQYSPTEEHFGVPWALSARRETDHLGSFVSCRQEEKDDEWSVDAWFEIKFNEVNGEANSKSCEHVFEGRYSRGCGWSEFISWEDVMKDFVIDDTLKVEVRVKIKKMTGIILKEKKKLRNFDESTKQFSDVVLVVEDQKFYVPKLYLASQSPYFEAMFLRNFKESNTTEIPLKDVKAADFQNFLEILYGEYSIDDSTVDGIAHLANMYDAKMAIRKCEQFLIENLKKSLKEKLRLAHRYNLKNLKNHCLSKITTVAEIRSVLADDLGEMDPSVVGALLQKSLSLRE